MNRNKAYLIFKRGRNEFSFIIALYTLFLVQNKNNTPVNLALYSGLLILGFWVVGLLAVKYLDPETPRLNPFSQDSLQAGWHHRNGLSLMCRGEYLKADYEFKLANRIMEKYIEDENYSS